MLQPIEISSSPAGDATTAGQTGAEQAGGCCGGACCSTSGAAATATTDARVSQSFEVDGMTCGHCVTSVTEELSGLAGVESVAIDLVAGGRSTVTVASDAPLRLDDVRAAVSEAGYSLVEG